MKEKMTISIKKDLEVFGSIVFLLNAYWGLTDKEIMAGLIFIVTGVLLLPYFNKLIENKFNIHLSGKFKIILASISIFIAILSI
ncbi:MAG: hypothetical protein ACD_20C00149G0002 [uncultured bacterium]|nr:MAG: hypothetical protein ACD_20C00149G0002 [uncultured bacterium]